MNLRRLGAVMLKEIRQLRRDRVTAAMIVGIPSIQLLLFGFAINLDVRGIDAGVVDLANTSASRALVQDLLATEVIVERARFATPAQLQDAIESGQVGVGIVVPNDFERRLAEGREAVQVVVDGSDTSVQNAARQLADFEVTGATRQKPIAVQSFYIISGFYMALVLDGKYRRTGLFYSNRLLRLAPAYFTMMAIAAVALWGFNASATGSPRCSASTCRRGRCKAPL